MRLLVIAILSLPMLALAAPTIKVTNFVMNDNNNFHDSTAELCGTITDRAQKHEKVIIISDPGRSQGFYVANVTPDGKFCHVIRTLSRQASVHAYTRMDNPRLLKNIPIHSATHK